MFAPSSAQPEIRQIEGYEILGELGRGGMGVVYKARQLGLNRIVALKMVLAGLHAGSEELARFRLEAEAAARLQHPNIVPIYEIGEHEGCPFFSMQLLEGGSLADLLDGKPWRSRRAAELLLPLAEAIHEAHQQGIIHRDLKPANILLTAGGVPKITDFGVAKQLNADSDAARPLTRSFALLGTPSYMSPEQAQCLRSEIGPTADVYSLGAILYQLLTGRPPFQAATPMDTVLRLLEDEPTPPRQLHPRVARDLQAVCLKCLEKAPQRRYGSALELANDLRRYLCKEPVHAVVPGPLGRLAGWARQRPALSATWLFLLVFYLRHLLSHLIYPSDVSASHPLFVLGLMLSWAAGAAGFQWLVRQAGWQTRAIYGWAVLDVVLFTALLWVQGGPNSSLLVGYLLLIAAAGLRFRPRLVWFVTEISLVSYAVLVVDAYSRQKLVDPSALQFPVVFALSLLLMGLILHLLFRRIRTTIGEDMLSLSCNRYDPSRPPPAT
ncbi:MAG TPA: serine/threonine-protein kinase [Gemmataceae bacterium]|nr:serine/threonine-protein kinase [Gemmataceae bacterium]